MAKNNSYRIVSRGRIWVVQKEGWLFWRDVYQGTYDDCWNWMMNAPLTGD